jgi:hypothetical protein
MVLDKIKGIPVIVTDGYLPYHTVMLERYGMWIRRPYKGRGRPSKDKLIPNPDLNYGQVIKTRKGKRLEKVEHTSVFGNVPKELLNTSAVERNNGTMRTHSSRLKRRSLTFPKTQETTNDSLKLYRAHYNLCRDHGSLCIPGKHNGGVYKHVSPAMEMKLTDHVWSMRELMGFSYRNNMSQ